MIVFKKLKLNYYKKLSNLKAIYSANALNSTLITKSTGAYILSLFPPPGGGGIISGGRDIWGRLSK